MTTDEEHEIRRTAEINLLAAYDLDASMDTREQLQVFMQAMEVYRERSVAYAEVWKQYGAMSNLLSVARKTDRMMSAWHGLSSGETIHKDDMDDAIDLLNYCTFFIRNFRSGNLFGSPPKRPWAASFARCFGNVMLSQLGKDIYGKP